MTDWNALAAADFALQGGVSAAQLVPEAFALLASPNSDERDGLAYPAFVTWIIGGELDAQLPEIGDQAAKLLGAPEAHTRSFAALLFPLLLARDSAAPQLQPTQWRAWLEAWAEWYAQETDLRSHTPELGWLHSVAHGADVAAAFAEHGGTTRQDLRRVLEALLARIRTVDAPLLQQEDDRVALAAFALLCRPELTEDDRREWLQGLGAAMQAEEGQPRPPSAAFAVQVARALLMFAQFGLGGSGESEGIPAEAAAEWRGELLEVLRGSFSEYGEGE